jgi:cytochrome c peroxidase
LNSAFNDWFYWDGRKDSLWSHPIFPLLSDVELDATPATVRQRMESTYVSEYSDAFGRAPMAEPDDDRIVANFGKAVEAYLRTLIKVRAPFDEDLDRFVAAARAGTAASDPLHVGMKTFIRKGRCIICHKGPMLSDSNFHNIGLKQAPPHDDHGHLTGIPMVTSDIWNGAGKYSDSPLSGKAKIDTLATIPHEDLDGAFKTPSLRNVALTAPYMHNSEYKTLEEVVDFYDRGGDPDGTFPGKRAETIIQLNLTAEEKRALIEMLLSMTGSEEP